MTERTVNTDEQYWEFDANGNQPRPMLRECPLCPGGGKPYFTRAVNGTNMIYVGCSRCGLELKAALVMVTPTKEQPTKNIVAVWNSRPDPATRMREACLEKVREILDGLMIEV